MQSKRYQHYALVGLPVLFVGVAMAMVQYKIPTIMTTIMALFDLSASEGSWLMSVFTLMAVFTAVLFGVLSQRFNPKKIIIVATCIIVAGSVLGAFAGVGWVLILSRAIEGVALTAVTTCGPIIIQKCVRPDKIGSALGIWGVWGPLGSVIAGLATPTLFTLFGFTVLWIEYAAVVVVATVVMVFVVREPRQEESIESTTLVSEKTQQATLGKPRYKDLFTRNTILFFVGFAAFNVCLLAVLSFVPTILQMRGMDATMSGFVSTLPMLLSVASSPFFGMLSDKIGSPKGLLVFAVAFLGPCAFLLYTQTGTIMWIAAIVMGLIGMGSSGLMLAAYMKVLPRPDLISIGMGVLITVQGIGQFLGTFLAQALLGPDFLNWFLAGGVVMGIGLLGTLCLAMCRMKR